MTYKVLTQKAEFFFNTREEAEEQASLICKKWRQFAFVLQLSPCIICGSDREDDKSAECNGCLMEMANGYN